MIDDIDIEGFSPARVMECAEVFAQAWASGHPAHPRVIDASVFVEETMGETVLVALAEGRVAGFVAIHGDARFVHHLYVHPAFQGRGVGRRLLRAAMQAGEGPLTLKCLLSNRRALGFYRREGWVAGERGSSPLGPWVRMIGPQGE